VKTIFLLPITVGPTAKSSIWCDGCGFSLQYYLN